MSERLNCHDCGKDPCCCEAPDLNIKAIRTDVRRAYYNGQKYDHMLSAEHTKVLLDRIDEMLAAYFTAERLKHFEDERLRAAIERVPICVTSDVHNRLIEQWKKGALGK